MTYYVIVERRRTGSQTGTEYLVALQWDPYGKGDGSRVTSDDANDAFPFQERAAAEMAAVFVGGTVVPVETSEA